MVGVGGELGEDAQRAASRGVWRGGMGDGVGDEDKEEEEKEEEEDKEETDKEKEEKDKDMSPLNQLLRRVSLWGHRH